MTVHPGQATGLAQPVNHGIDELVHSAISLARVFAADGQLLVTAPGRQDHARHVAVEFIHPAVTGARALPARAVATEDLTGAVGANDAVVVIEHRDHPVPSTPPAALTIRVGGSDNPLSGSDLVRWYHLLWELVQVGLEHPGITGGSASAGGDSTNFLYPFLDASEVDDEALQSALVTSANTKSTQSDLLRAATIEHNSDALDAASNDIAACSAAGGTVFAFGNGGSACDASRTVRLLTSIGVQATSLSDDPAILTALANDLGAKMIFSRQLEAALRPNDMIIAFSTSGSSPNLLAALDVPGATVTPVIACSGYGGGPLADHPNVNHRLVVESSSVHRVQEAQSALIDELTHRLSLAAGR